MGAGSSGSKKADTLMAQIDAPHFCAGILLRDDKVFICAPILKYMMGWNRDTVRDYCAKKGWTIRAKWVKD